MRTSELTGRALDYAAALADGQEPMLHGRIWWTRRSKMLSDIGDDTSIIYSPSRFWKQGGPIIEREQINLFKHDRNDEEWQAGIMRTDPGKTHRMQAQETGPTMLIAAMRCYVASKLGNEIEIPKELQS